MRHTNLTPFSSTGLELRPVQTPETASTASTTAVEAANRMPQRAARHLQEDDLEALNAALHAAFAARLSIEPPLTSP